MSETIKNLAWRYATKKYDTTKKLSDEQLHIIKESMRMSPSSFGVQPWAFVHVTSPEIRAKLKDAAWAQSPITDASELFVLCARTTFDEQYVDKFIEFTAGVQGITASDLAGYKNMIMGMVAKSDEEKKEWMTRQVYIALGVALAVAAENHIDTTPIEGFQPQVFDEILGLSDMGLASRVVLTVGFRADDDKYKDGKKVRFPESDVFIEK